MSIRTDYRTLTYEESWAPERASPECAVVCEGMSPGSYSEEQLENPQLAAGLIRMVTKPEQDCFNVMILTKADLTVGRESQCDFVITSIDVSRKQCKVEFRRNRWWLRNLSNTNGTYVNGTKVAEGCCYPLSDGNFVSFGPICGASFKYLFVEDYEQYARLENVRFARASILSQSESNLQDEVQQVATQHVKSCEDVQSEIDTLKAVANSWYEKINQLKKEHELADNMVKISQAENKRINKDILILRENERLIRERAKDCDEPLQRIPFFKKLLSEVTCSICHEVMISPVLLKCKHGFCEWCVKKWRVQGNFDCPCCRDKSIMNNLMYRSVQLERIVDIISEYMFLQPETLEERKKSVVEHEKGLKEMSSIHKLWTEEIPASGLNAPIGYPNYHSRRDYGYVNFLTVTRYGLDETRQQPVNINRDSAATSREEEAPIEPFLIPSIEDEEADALEDDDEVEEVGGDNDEIVDMQVLSDESEDDNEVIFESTEAPSVAIYVEVGTDSSSEGEEEVIPPSSPMRPSLRRIGRQMPSRRAARMNPYSRDGNNLTISLIIHQCSRSPQWRVWRPPGPPINRARRVPNESFIDGKRKL